MNCLVREYLYTPFWTGSTNLILTLLLLSPYHLWMECHPWLIDSARNWSRVGTMRITPYLPLVLHNLFTHLNHYTCLLHTTLINCFMATHYTFSCRDGIIPPYYPSYRRTDLKLNTKPHWLDVFSKFTISKQAICDKQSKLIKVIIYSPYSIST